MEKWSSSKFKDTFFEFEIEYNAFKTEIFGVYFWKLIRTDLFVFLKSRLVTGGNKATASLAKYTGSQRIKKFFTPTSSPLINSDNIDYLIFDRGKKNLYRDELVDVFSIDIQDQIEEAKEHYRIIDFPYFSDYSREVNEIRKNIESMHFFNSVTEKFVNFRFNEEEKEQIKYIEKGLSETFGDDFIKPFKLTRKITNEVVRFKKEYAYFRKLFLVSSPKKVFTTIYYRRHSMVAAARDLNITVVDIQYANINSFHSGYGFPENVHIPYFPDELIIWGQYFKDVTQLPNNVKINIKAPNYFKEIVDEKMAIKKEKKTLLFGSQRTIGEKLFQIAYHFAKRNKDYTVLFRLHPGEIGKYEEYENYENANALDNFQFSTKETDDLHDLFVRSSFQVGVYSTTMIEGLLHDCKPIFANFEGLEEMEYFHKNGYAPLINNEEELLNSIEHYSYKEIDVDYFFKYNDTKII